MTYRITITGSPQGTLAKDITVDEGIAIMFLLYAKEVAPAEEIVHTRPAANLLVDGAKRAGGGDLERSKRSQSRTESESSLPKHRNLSRRISSAKANSRPTRSPRKSGATPASST